jgi:hypothetical protein
MKYLSALRFSAVLILLALYGVPALGQAPNLMAFQAVIHDTSGALVVSSPVGMRMSILSDSATGPSVYVERQMPTTDAYGLAAIEIGAGTVLSGSIDSINWSSGRYYIKCDIDPFGGTSYTLSATQQLASVPYAFYAAHSGNGGSFATVSTDSTGTISWYSASCYGTVATTGNSVILLRGVCVDTVALPTLNTAYAATGNTAGSFAVNVSGLQSNTRYHVRAFATNGKGTAFGDTSSFTTLLTAPFFGSDTVPTIGATFAVASAVIGCDGGAPVTARGFCWSTSDSPTLASSIVTDGAVGPGAYSDTLPSLLPSTTYFIRPYATNTVGTAYGRQDSIRTREFTPGVVYTDSVSAINFNGALCGINVVTEGAPYIYSQGLCWNTTSNPQRTDAHVTVSPGTGDFEVAVSGLLPGTTYYVRAFCYNPAGTVYGEQVIFNTLAATPPALTTVAPSSVAVLGATVGGNVSSDEGSTISVHGVCYGTTPFATADSGHATAAGPYLGAFTVNLSGLYPSTKYYYRAYATNGVGTGYGGLDSFSTSSSLSLAPAVPVVGTTCPLVSVDSTIATGGYVLVSPGSAVTAYGVCWSTTSSTPSIADPHTTDGAGEGAFTSLMAGIDPCPTTYYISAYATNATGTGYGDVCVFTTSSVGAVTDSAVTGITSTTAHSGGHVSADGGCPIFARGNVWVIADFDSGYYAGAGGPVVGMSYSDTTWDGSGIGSFSSNLSGLIAGATYHVRAYASNAGSTAYGTTQTIVAGGPGSGAHYIGENYAGGVIFYLDSTGQHGMVAGLDPQNLISGWSIWGCYDIDVAGTDTAFGSGVTNTAYILGQCNDSSSAAFYCSQVHAGGYSDWFLPSLGELEVLVNNLAAIDYPGYLTQPPTCPTCFSATWWSSSAAAPGSAFYYGQAMQYGGPSSDMVGDPYNVLPIRKF